MARDAFLNDGTTTSNADGWVPQLQDDDVMPGKVIDDTSAYANTWRDDNPGQRKRIQGAGAHGDGINGVIEQEVSQSGTNAVPSTVSTHYMQTNAGNTFPKGSGPDAEAQNLRGYALNEPPSGGSLDIEGPKHGPLYVPKIRTPNTTTQVPYDTVSKASPPSGGRRTFTPETPGPGVPKSRGSESGD